MRPTRLHGLDLAPGLVYRFRHDNDQRFVPFVGANHLFPSYFAGRSFLGLPASPPAPGTHLVKLDEDLDATSAELVGGVEWHPSRWFCVAATVGYTHNEAAGVGVSLLRETVAFRFTL